MPTYHYQFDRTSESLNFTASSTVSNDGHDISEFDGDSRGTARIADWSDFSSFNQSQFDALVEVFAIPTPAQTSIGYFSFDGHAGQANKYYHVTGRAYYLGMSWTQYYSGGWNNNNNITTDPMRKLHVGSWRGARPIVVYFPNYKANGGHDSLLINGATATTWSDTNNRFQSSDSLTTLTHNGSTWVINAGGITSGASLNSVGVASYIDPASSDLVWENNSFVSTDFDPHALLCRIHSEKNAVTLEANIESYSKEINAFLNGVGAFEESYYNQHIGRELNKKLRLFGLEKYFSLNGGHNGISIHDPIDGGGRPNFASGKQSQSIIVGSMAQWANLSAGSINLSAFATSSSGLPVVYSVHHLDSDRGSINGTTLNLLGPGNVTLLMDQEGDSQYFPATQIARTITVVNA